MESYKQTDGRLNMIDAEYNFDSVLEYQNEVIDKKAEEFRNKNIGTKAEQIIEKQDSLEIMPINQYILVKPYEVNPYQKIEVSESGIAMNTLNKGMHISRETGEEEQSETWSRVGQVIEVSPACKYVKVGDDIMYRKPSAVPVPFFNLGMEVVAEQSVQVVINEKLKERLSLS